MNNVIFYCGHNLIHNTVIKCISSVIKINSIRHSECFAMFKPIFKFYMYAFPTHNCWLRYSLNFLKSFY